MVRRILLSRGIEVPDDFPADLPTFAESSDDAVIDAALTCESESDFRARLRPHRP